MAIKILLIDDYTFIESLNVFHLIYYGDKGVSSEKFMNLPREQASIIFLNFFVINFVSILFFDEINKILGLIHSEEN